MTLRDKAVNLCSAIGELPASERQAEVRIMASELVVRIGHFEELSEAMSDALHKMVNECTCKLAEANRELIEAQQKGMNQ